MNDKDKLSPFESLKLAISAVKTVLDRKINDLADTKTLSSTLNEAYKDYALLGSYTQQDETDAEVTENFTLTFSESINNFAMLFICVRSGHYVMGSSFIPTVFFKSGMVFELNCVNDTDRPFNGNLQYQTDTTASGKISGYTSDFEVYGFLRINN